MNPDVESSPLWLDLQDLERDVAMLEQTNVELEKLASEFSNPEDSHAMRLVVVENQYAMHAKRARAAQIRTSLGIATPTPDAPDGAGAPRAPAVADERSQPGSLDREEDAGAVSLTL